MEPGVLAWLCRQRPFRYPLLGLPNYPIETLAIVTPANDNRETPDEIRAIVLAQRTRRELGLPDGLLPHILHRITRRTP